jgi:branched-chain amino acid transport system substrate-binding protein
MSVELRNVLSQVAEDVSELQQGTRTPSRSAVVPAEISPDACLAVPRAKPPRPAGPRGAWLKARSMAAAATWAAIAGWAATAPAAAETFRIGFITTLTTPARFSGEDLRDGFLLGLDEIGHKAGDIAIEAIIEDDAFSPDVGLAATKKLVDQDKVDIVTGHIWSNIVVPSSEYVLKAGKVFISANAGATVRAGKGCHPNYFNVSFQNDQLPAAIGKFFSERGSSKAYVIAADYAAGRDMAQGFKSAFAGEIVGESLTRWNPTPDTKFGPPLAKAGELGADVVFAFYPGGLGADFLRQYQTSGLVGKIGLATSFIVDAIALRRLEAENVGGVWGMLTAVHWARNLDNAQNKRFVAAFEKRYGREPTYYAAQSFDMVFLLKAALERTKSAFRDAAALRTALRTVDWPSTRGRVRFGKNNFLIQDIYLATTVVEEAGWVLRARDAIEHQAVDSAAKDCQMPQ